MCVYSDKGRSIRSSGNPGGRSTVKSLETRPIRRNPSVHSRHQRWSVFRFLSRSDRLYRFPDWFFNTLFAAFGYFSAQTSCWERTNNFIVENETNVILRVEHRSGKSTRKIDIDRGRVDSTKVHSLGLKLKKRKKIRTPLNEIQF